MEIPGTKCFVPKGFALGTTLSADLIYCFYILTLVNFPLTGEISLTLFLINNVQPESLRLSKQRVVLFLWLAHLNNKNTVCKQ